MHLRHTVELSHVTLRLVPEVLDPDYVIVSVGEQLLVIDPKVLEVGDVPRVIAAPAVGIDDAVRRDLARHDRHQRIA